MKKIDLDESVLRQMVEEDRLIDDIARHFGCHKGTIENRMRKLGLRKQRTGPKSGERHTNWKGGRILIGGYWHIYLPDHPNAHKRGYVAEHRLVMEQKLGRYLGRKEVCHHVDGNCQNNHPDNLMVFGSNADHLKHELTGKCPEWSPTGYAKMCAPRKDFDDLSQSGKEKRLATERQRRNLDS